jgi:hypothetical protein
MADVVLELINLHMNDHCRPLVIDIDEESPGGPSESSAEKPSVAHTWEKRCVPFLMRGMEPAL